MKNKLAYLAIALIGFSCSDEETVSVDPNTTPEENEINLLADSLVSDKLEKIDNILYAVPSPTETIRILEQAGAVYDIQLTNDPINVDIYTSKTEKALNLGVYGADVNYCSVFGKSNDILMLCLSAQKLSEDLGLGSIFTQETYERLDENLDVKDSIQAIVASTYWELESYLEEDGRPELANLIVIGGWVEGMYMACGQAKINMENEEMIQRIAEQRYALESVIELTKLYESKNPALKELLEKLLDLETSFAQIETVKTDGENTTDNDGVISIGGAIKHDLDQDLLEEITVKVYKIREEIVQ